MASDEDVSPVELATTDSVFDMDKLEDSETAELTQLNDLPEEPKPVRPLVAYKDFETIDWLEFNAHERHRLDKIENLIKRWWEYSKPWLLMALIGFTTGAVASLLNIWHYWMVDLRLGYCKVGWALNMDFCCWEGLEESCEHWHSWDGSEPHKDNGNFGVGYVAYIGFSLCFGLIAAMLVKHYSAFAAGSGIPEVKVIVNGFIFHRYLNLRTLFFKALSLAAAVSTSLNLGKEGPMVHLAVCAANVWGTAFKAVRNNEAVKRELYACAAGIGVAAAFGAPIGGVLFTYEEASANFPVRTMMRTLVGTGFASLAIRMIDPFRTGRIVEFIVTYDPSHLWHSFELFNYIILGVIGGLLGTFFVVFNIKVNRIRKNSFLAKWPVTDVLALVLLSTLLQYPMKVSRLPSGHLMGEMFRPCGSGEDELGLCGAEDPWPMIGQLTATAIIKVLLMTITIGAKVPAGLFIPSLALGSCIGRAFGMAVEAIIAAFGSTSRSNPSYFWWAACPAEGMCVNAAFYGVAGAFATLVGVTRITLSLTVIALEITGAVQYLIPLMLTLIVAKWTAEAVHHRGIYHEQILAAGYPFLDSVETYVRPTTVKQIMTAHPRTIVADQVTLSELEALLQDSNVSGYPVVQLGPDGDPDQQRIVGYLSHGDIATGLDRARREDVPFSRIARMSPSQRPGGSGVLNGGSSSGLLAWSSDALSPGAGAAGEMFDFRPFMVAAPMMVPMDQPVETTHEIFVRLSVRFVLVEDRGNLVGILTKKDLIRHLMRDEYHHPMTGLKF